MSLLAKPERPILCYVTDRRSLALSTSADAHKLLFDSVQRAAAAGADWIQLREKDYSGKEWEELVGESVQRISRVGATTRLFVNDRMDVALACGAGGVHLSENGLPVSEACRLREEFFSVHPVPSAERTLKQSLENISNCSDLKSRQIPELSTWLHQKGSASGK